MSVVTQAQEYCWILDNRQLQLLLMQLNMKGGMQLAKFSTTLSSGLLSRVFANISKGARKNLEDELVLLKSKVTLDAQEQAAELFMQIFNALTKEHTIELPESLSSVGYINGESLALFKDENITSRKELESWIIISNSLELSKLLLKAKSQLGSTYVHAIVSVSKEFRKYLLPFVEAEDYEVLINSFTKETFNTLRLSQIIRARRSLSQILSKAYQGVVVPKSRDLIYQGAILNTSWWQLRLEWEELQSRLNDEQLRNLLMSYTAQEVVLVYYESPKEIRDRLYGLFSENIGGILRFLYREAPTEELGEGADAVRRQMVIAATKLV